MKLVWNIKKQTSNKQDRDVKKSNEMNSNNDENNRVKFYIYSAAWDGKVAQFRFDLSKKGDKCNKGQSQTLALSQDVTSNNSASGNGDDNPSKYVPKTKKIDSKAAKIPRTLNKRGAEAEANSRSDDDSGKIDRHMIVR